MQSGHRIGRICAFGVDATGTWIDTTSIQYRSTSTQYRHSIDPASMQYRCNIDQHRRSIDAVSMQYRHMILRSLLHRCSMRFSCGRRGSSLLTQSLLWHRFLVAASLLVPSESSGFLLLGIFWSLPTALGTFSVPLARDLLVLAGFRVLGIFWSVDGVVRLG